MEHKIYETPRIVFEGDLEVQAGTPGSEMVDDWFDEVL